MIKEFLPITSIDKKPNIEEGRFQDLSRGVQSKQHYGDPGHHQ